MEFPKNISVNDENDIIRRIQNGETDLFLTISAKYLPVINYYVSALDFNLSDRDDIIQEGLMALYSATRVYDFSSASFSTFASVCIKRSLLSALRHIYQKKHIPAHLIDNIDDISVIDGLGPEEAVINNESFTYFLDKIKLSLSSFEYSVLAAYLKFGNYNETADYLNVSVKNINNALQRIRKKILKINR